MHIENWQENWSLWLKLLLSCNTGLEIPRSELKQHTGVWPSKRRIQNLEPSLCNHFFSMSFGGCVLPILTISFVIRSLRKKTPTHTSKKKQNHGIGWSSVGKLCWEFELGFPKSCSSVLSSTWGSPEVDPALPAPCWGEWKDHLPQPADNALPMQPTLKQSWQRSDSPAGPCVIRAFPTLFLFFTVTPRFGRMSFLWKLIPSSFPDSAFIWILPVFRRLSWMQMPGLTFC